MLLVDPELLLDPVLVMPPTDTLPLDWEGEDGVEVGTLSVKLAEGLLNDAAA